MRLQNEKTKDNEAAKKHEKKKSLLDMPSGAASR